MILTAGQTQLMREVVVAFTKILVLLVSLYLFVCSLSLLSTGFKITGGKNIGVVGVMLGVLVTVLVQSSSTSTSILVGLVAAGAPVSRVIPMVLGANIGTSVTNTVVAITHIGDKEQFRRAFSCATVHDMFNWLSVVVFTTVEMATHYLELTTEWMVNHLTVHSSLHSPDLLKAATKPLIKLLVRLDLSVLEAWASNSTNATSLLKQGCSSSPTLSCNYLLAYLGREGLGLADLYTGIILVAFSLIVMCCCLLSVVKLLNSLLGERVTELIKKSLNSDLPYVPWLTGYLAMAVGALLTFLLQSSSVFTSTLTPLAGAGLVTLERAYPLTLGSNIGTTTTSILASLAADGDRQKPALQIALVHLLFNMSGILLFYVVPYMRLPIHLARILGDTTATYPWFAVVYLLGMFFLLPSAVFSLSLAGPLVLYPTLTLVLALILLITIISLLQHHAPTLLPPTLQTWLFLPLPLRSLQPWDSIISRLYCCGSEPVQEEEAVLTQLVIHPPIIKMSPSDIKLSQVQPVYVQLPLDDASSVVGDQSSTKQFNSMLNLKDGSEGGAYSSVDTLDTIDSRN